MRQNLVCIDFPQHFATDEPTFLLQGWIATMQPVQKIWIQVAEAILELPPHPRPDAEQAVSNYSQVIGFQHHVPHAALQQGRLQLYYRIADEIFTYIHLVTQPFSPIAKLEKLARIAPFLKCPKCGGALQLLEHRTVCQSCQQIYPKTEQHFDFLTPELRQAYQIIDTNDVSHHEYDRYAQEVIRRFPDGLVLDCGAGSRGVNYSNVINFEIANYLSTDVLGVAEQLPFQDETFDGVLSLAVLEHVSDPFRCAAEIARVLKKGGRVYCVVPFLQPVHAYPNHFYNMTAQGLANLFTRHQLQIRDSFVPLSGVPMWSLGAILKSWAQNLDGATREQFLNLRVADLLEEPIHYLDQDFVRNLPDATNFELACTTAIIAEKT